MKLKSGFYVARIEFVRCTQDYSGQMIVSFFVFAKLTSPGDRPHWVALHLDLKCLLKNPFRNFQS